MLTTEQKLLAALAHGGTFVGFPIIAPLLILLLSKDDYVKNQAKEGLVFQLVLAAGFAVSAILVVVVIGIIGLIGFGIAAFVFPIIAIVNVANGNDYSYPITGQWARKI
jgi:uncharacterized Tic20 family protein